MASKIQEIEGIGPAYAEKLTAADISTTDDLLKLCCDAKGRASTAEKTGVSEAQLLKWANMADLMRISGIGRQYAELLHAAGVDTVKELRTRNADNLAAKMNEINEDKKLTKGQASAATVGDWIKKAGEINPKMTY